MKRLGSLIGMLAMGACVASAQAQTLSQPQVERFASYDPTSQVSVDYDAFTMILSHIIFNVGPSDRRVESVRIVTTGSRLNQANNSRYRTESNRIWFHTLDDIHEESVSAYREELEALYAAAPVSALSRDEQLAYWLNLHNIVLLDELIREYPLGRVDRVFLDGVRLTEAKIIEIEGGPISLDDIRTQIVPALTDDPRAMYGFYTGAIGGPSLPPRAYDGDSVWRQLDSVGSEFVNALRGVDISENPVRISPLYFEARERYFPDWPDDLSRHLRRYADPDVLSILNNGDDYRPLRFEHRVADMSNGSLCGAGSYLYVRTVGDGPQSPGAACNPLPRATRQLIIDVQERRLRLFERGELGEVTVRDIPTEDPDDRDGSR